MEEKINLFLDWIKQHTIYKQFLPAKEDLENRELKNLSLRLKSNSLNTSLINILEWQDRNIKVWVERWITSGILTLFTLLSIVIISFYFGKTNHYLYWLFLLIPLIVWGNITLNIVLYLVVLFVSILTIPLTLTIFSPALNISSSIFLVFLAFSFILGVFISLLINLFLNYQGLKNHIPDFNIGDTFRLSLPIEKILKYRLSICRDYAKLTSALILSIYPQEEMYYILIPQHVAVGVKLNDIIYVLDQKLPILTLDKWKEKWRIRLKKRNLKIDLIRIYLEDGNVKIKSLRREEMSSGSSESELINLVNDIRRSFKLKNNKPKTEPTLELPLKDFMMIFSNDDLVKGSMQESIKNKIEDELATNISGLSYLDAEIKNNDLVLKLWLIWSKNQNSNKLK